MRSEAGARRPRETTAVKLNQLHTAVKSPGPGLSVEEGTARVRAQLAERMSRIDSELRERDRRIADLNRRAM